MRCTCLGDSRVVETIEHERKETANSSFLFLRPVFVWSTEMSVRQAVANVMKKKRHIINRLLSETLASSSSSSTAPLSCGT